ncbi:MAG: hypothetical protein LBR39_07610, partial [Coriobacteriales bacterium]|nr:hypothetical protein [Coriobacteriales bacterium]
MPASFESIKPVNLDFPWLQAFTVAALRSDGTVADFTAGSAVGEASRRELEAELSPLSVTWLALEHGLTVARVPAQNSQQIKSLKS